MYANARASSGVCAASSLYGAGSVSAIYLRRIDADLALQQDQVFRLLILRSNQRLLLRLQLHLRAQLIKICRGTRHVRLVRVIFKHLRLRHQRLLVLYLACVGDGAQICRGHLLHHLASRSHFAEIS